MDDLILYLVFHIGLGTLLAVSYRCLYRGPFRFRHVLCYPVLMSCMLARLAPPRWMAPAPRDVAADARRARWRQL